MYDNFFYDHICTIYTISDTIVNGAEKKSKTALYSDIPCAIRQIKSNNLNDTPIGRQGDTATHRINIDWLYNDISVGMICSIDSREYHVVDYVTYNDIDNSIDNTSLYVRVR